MCPLEASDVLTAPICVMSWLLSTGWFQARSSVFCDCPIWWLSKSPSHGPGLSLFIRKEKVARALRTIWRDITVFHEVGRSRSRF